MKNKLFLLFALFFLCVFISCGEGVIADKKCVGNIIDANVVSTSFNESVKTQIKTEKLFVVIRGLPTVEIGAKAFVITYGGGAMYFTWEGSKKSYRIRS